MTFTIKAVDLIQRPAGLYVKNGSVRTVDTGLTAQDAVIFLSKNGAVDDGIDKHNQVQYFLVEETA